MILMEPALYSLARGAGHVENHIARMSPVIVAAPHLGAAEYYLEWLRALGVPDPVRPATPEEMQMAERTRLLTPPWDIATPAAVIPTVPTLVITGGWNDEYEEIASALVRSGAARRQLTGFGHRVPDHPDANSLIREWIKRH